MKPTRLVAVAATVAALAGVAASPAAADPTPSPSATKAGAATADSDLAQQAAALGVTKDRLIAALVAAKQSLAGSTSVTPDAFVAAVAANLGLPVAQVSAVLTPMLTKPDAPKARGEGTTKAEGEKAEGDKQGGAEQAQPFSIDEAAAVLAASLGIDQAKAKDAMTALVAMGRSDTTSSAFQDLAASLGVSADQLEAAVRHLKETMAAR